MQLFIVAAAFATLSSNSVLASETPRLDSAVGLRQQALQRILKHSQKPEDIDATLALYKSAIDASEKENGSGCSYTGDLYFERGSYAFDNSRFQIALDNLNKAVQINPSSITARLRLIKLLEVRKDSIEARQQIQQLLTRHSDCKEGRQLLVASMQKFDPAAATRQAFSVDKFVKLPAVEKPAPQAAQSTPASPAAAKPTDVAPLSSVLSLRSPHAKPPEVVQPPKPAAAATPPSAEASAVIEAVSSVQREVAKFAKATPPKEAKPEKKSAPKVAKSEKKKTAAQHATALSLDIPPPPGSKPAKAKSGGGKMAAGLVPPPPPTPFAFPMPGMGIPRPDLSNGGLQLKTDAKIKKPAAEKKAAPEKISVPPVPNIPTPGESASPAPKGNADSDPDFLLEWGGANKKKKK
jgi:tetratricopeptide (TPR) repeat protein